MKLFGLPVPFTSGRSVSTEVVSEAKELHAVGGGWISLIRESVTGAWQRNIVVDRNRCGTFHADFACKTLIARDCAKLRVLLKGEDENGLWTGTKSAAYDPVLRIPNHYQTRNQFWETWFLSKLSRGNTYVFKERDNRNVVIGLHVLDPNRTTPLVADDGSVFYRLAGDNLAGVNGDIIVPAREIIHDRMNCLFHPLVGLPPVFASGLAAMQGLNIQANSIRLFENNSQPGGILTTTGNIPDATAERLKDQWEQMAGGKNFGRLVVLGDGLKYEKMVLTAVEGQMIEQLKWTAEVVCSTYHVPPYKIGVGAMPSYNNVQALNVEYYSQALQSLLEEAEECLDRGLGIGFGTGLGTEFDIENLLRMDSVTQITTLKDAVGGMIMASNEARAKLGLKPVRGGDVPFGQHQDYPIDMLADRNRPPPGAAGPSGAQSVAPSANNDNRASDEDIAAAGVVAAWKLKSLLAAA